MFAAPGTSHCVGSFSHTHTHTAMTTNRKKTSLTATDFCLLIKHALSVLPTVLMAHSIQITYKASGWNRRLVLMFDNASLHTAYS